MRVSVFLPLVHCQPEDTIHAVHVAAKPDPVGFDSDVEIPSHAVLLRRGEELCDEYRERARDSGLDIRVWAVLSDNVAKEIIFWSNLLHIDFIVIGLNRGY